MRRTEVTPSENELYSEESEQQNVSDDLIPKCESTPTDEPQMGFGYCLPKEKPYRFICESFGLLLIF